MTTTHKPLHQLLRVASHLLDQAAADVARPTSIRSPTTSSASAAR
jgi:hypothetical protein